MRNSGSTKNWEHGPGEPLNNIIVAAKKREEMLKIHKDIIHILTPLGKLIFKN